MVNSMGELFRNYWESITIGFDPRGTYTTPTEFLLFCFFIIFFHGGLGLWWSLRDVPTKWVGLSPRALGFTPLRPRVSGCTGDGSHAPAPWAVYRSPLWWGKALPWLLVCLLVGGSGFMSARPPKRLARRGHHQVYPLPPQLDTMQ